MALPLWHPCLRQATQELWARPPPPPTRTLSPSDPLSRWASSQQSWHCLALLSQRQPVPAPGLGSGCYRCKNTGPAHRGCPSQRSREWACLCQVFFRVRSPHCSPTYLPTSRTTLCLHAPICPPRKGPTAPQSVTPTTDPQALPAWFSTLPPST